MFSKRRSCFRAAGRQAESILRWEGGSCSQGAPAWDPPVATYSVEVVWVGSWMWRGTTLPAPSLRCAGAVGEGPPCLGCSPPTHRGSLPALGCGPDIIALWGEGVPAPAGPLTHAHPQRWGQLHRSTHSLTHRLLNLTLGAFPTPFSCSSRIPTPLGSQTMRN